MRARAHTSFCTAIWVIACQTRTTETKSRLHIENVQMKSTHAGPSEYVQHNKLIDYYYYIYVAFRSYLSQFVYSLAVKHWID